jgi:phosphodiesterase/alkaline phosphatase D-like protein
MRRFVVVAAAGTLALAALSAEAATPSLRYGVAAGEITSTSALRGLRTDGF